MMKATSIILFTLVLVVIIYFTLQDNFIDKHNFVVRKVDTIIKIIPQKEIKIVEAKPKIQYIRDTIIQTQPFVARLDTILLRDTIYAQYQFPENLMSINIRTSGDSIRLPQITVERTKQERKWYELATAFGGGIILGLLIGK